MTIADPEGRAFEQTAWLMRQLDLIITPDNALAHLAGGLGVPTWILLGRVPDWRWQITGQDCHWYPTARLFRQPSHGDWNSVFQEVAVQLSQFSS
ncbi:MAG TPA: hypothetical protein DCF63_00240 [Planctomycetaceae bacterium]|nr:hypothetical protein [Planctomycetaceae bacterium]